MSARAKRINALVGRYGESLVVNGVRSVRAIVFLATGSMVRSLFHEEEIAPLNYPLWAGVLSAAEELQEGDTLVREGATYTVRRVVILKVGDTPIAKMAVWSRQGSGSSGGQW